MKNKNEMNKIKKLKMLKDYIFYKRYSVTYKLFDKKTVDIKKELNFN